MPSVFDYTDYRKYLADYYKEQKAKNKAFSYQNWANKAGFKNKGFIRNIMTGKKNLTKSTIPQICESIGMAQSEADYLEALVSFNHANNLREQNFYYEKLAAIKTTKSEGSKAQKLKKEQFEYFAKWYNVVIRSLIDLYPFKDDYRWLAKMVDPPIKSRQAKKSVELLETLGLIKKQSNGFYKVTSKSVTSGKEVINFALEQFHLETTNLAASAIRDLPLEKRNISGLTLGITQECYKKICRRIYEVQDEIIKMAEEDKNSDRVFQLNFHFFPVSNVDNKKGVTK